MAILIIPPVKDGGAHSPSSEMGGKHSNTRKLDRVASSEGSLVSIKYNLNELVNEFFFAINESRF
jgi:hypothetical protein